MVLKVLKEFKEFLYKVFRVKDKTEEELAFRKTVARGMTIVRKGLREAGYSGYLHAAGYEADDIIAALHGVYYPEEIVIVSTDKDLYQLLSGNTTIYRPGANPSLMTIQNFHKMFSGLRPDRWATVKALAGCSSDNVPGMSGVAELTAVRYFTGSSPIPANKVGKIVKHQLTTDYMRDLRLVSIPFNGQIITAVSRAVADRRVPQFTQLMWESVCKMFGIKKLPYPRC